MNMSIGFYRYRFKLPWWTVWIEIQKVNKEAGPIRGGWK